LHLLLNPLKLGDMKTAIPLETGILHFTGIGGIGMSGIAEILHNLGYKVRGSDLSDNANVRRLRLLGIPVTIGQRPEQVLGAAFVVISSAVKADNPEYASARAEGIPIVRRAEMLAELARLRWSIAIAGTHGKTTTTTMVAAMLEAAALDPTVVNGGIINAWGSNTRLGAGEWIVMEADESDGTFLRLHPTIGVVTNIDPEHLDYYGDYENLQRAFLNFVQDLPFYGCAVLCRDHPAVAALVPRLSDRKVTTYGLNAPADLTAENIRVEGEGSVFDIVLADRRIDGVRLGMVGAHNISNALAAVGVALHLRLDDATIRRGLANFSGVGRRFSKVGVVGGVTIIDDYGHHPTEIEAVLASARQLCRGRIHAVIQPHRFSRLHNLWERFAACGRDADSVILAPVYAAGEPPLPGVTAERLADAMRAQGQREVMVLDGLESLPQVLAGLIQPGDYVICLGAGDITAHAQGLVERLQVMETA
jgi:UDP-N-acetylmuramate--alanine ligase